MDCHQAQAQLELANRGKDAVRSADAVAAERHVAECDVCQLAMRSQQRVDDQITRAMGNVPLPDGLTQRLHASINSATTLGPQPTVKPPRRQFLQRVVWGSLAAVAIVVTCAVVLPRSGVLSDANIRELGNLDLTTLPVNSSPVPSLPLGWTSQRLVRFADARIGTVGGRNVLLQTFNAWTDRRSSSGSTGFLMKLPQSQWHDVPDATSFGRAQIQYASFGTWVVWREGDSVIVCVLHADAHAMERLQEIVSGGRQLS